MFFSTFNYISINLISHTNVGKDRNETGSVLMNEKEIFVLGCASHVSKGMCTAQKLEVPVQELEITLQQLNRQKARQLTGHCCN